MQVYDALFHLKVLFKSKNVLLQAFVNNDILLKIKRDRRKCGCDAVKVEFLKQLRKMENNSNEIFSNILEQCAKTVVISHLNTLKHRVAVELRYTAPSSA